MRVRSRTCIGTSVVVLLLCLASCAPQDKRVSALESKVAGLEKQIEELKFQVELQSTMGNWDQVAYLTPGSSGYGVVKMDLGHLTVSLANILPYANGSKISLVFGNLTSATIDGLKAKIEWGSVDQKGMPKNAEAKSRDISLTESLFPGAWNKTEVVLEGVPPTALGFVRIRDVGHNGVRLRGSAK
jgi:hypothetical protein